MSTPLPGENPSLDDPPPDDAVAIVRLEAAIIPWQDQMHGPGARRLREESAANPLRAAEGLLGRGPRPRAPGVGRQRPAGSGGRGSRRHEAASGHSNGPQTHTAEEFARQGRQILAWAKRQGRLIDRRLEHRLVALGGVEHEVFLDDTTGRWLKLTMPGKGGKELHAREEGVGVRPTLLTEDALPSSYLRRLVLANGRLGDDFWLHGVIAHPDGPRLVVSQRDIDGEPATPREIAQHFVTAGYAQVNAKTFYQPEKNLLVSDAHTANVFKTPLGVAPFDVCVQQPRDALRRAVLPSPNLSFDDWGDDGQAGLEL